MKNLYQIKEEAKNNSSLTVLITNVDLDQSRLKQMAHQVHTSMGKYIRPFNTIQDGDILYACSTRSKKMKLNSVEFLALCSQMEKVTEMAVEKSVV